MDKVHKSFQYFFSDKMADKSANHKCDYCDRILASAQSLKNHQVLHTGQDKYRFNPRINLH